MAPTLDGEVLVTLAGTTRPLTGRQVAQLVHRGSQKAVSSALERLVHQGLVEREQAGRAYLHILNRDHVGAPAVDALAAMRSELISRLRGALEGWSPPPLHASLFGSAARGDGDVSSDIDLLVVRPGDVDEEDATWRSQVDALATSVQRWTGNPAGLVELAADELPRLRRRAPRVLREVRADGIDLVGTPVHELFPASS